MLSYIHKIAGWVIFLQEFWGRPTWPLNFFYEPQPRREGSKCHYSKNGTFEFEITDDLQNIEFTGGELKFAKSGRLIAGRSLSKDRSIIYSNES
jgi:hypothetical protein